ncbi:MAG: GNAT family N-acetyltransferase, partial [Planctomycetota bacterium]
YHPRKYHVSLGIVCVHTDHGKKGIGRSLVDYILRFTQEKNYKSCRLVASAINMDSFSLYNRSGFVPRVIYQDMVINVSADNLNPHVPGKDRVRDALVKDVAGMGDLEMELSGIKREMDYLYAIENSRNVLHASVYENDRHGIDGFMISIKHPALNMIGPCVARSQTIAIALMGRELERFSGTWALLVVPMEQRKMVEQLYGWGALNVETHLKQVWGEFQECKGIEMPSFLPETG